MKIKHKKTYLSIIVLIIIAAGAYFKLSQKPATQYVTVPAEIGNLVQTVSESGTVKTVNQLDLNFLATGKLAKQNVKIGDQVTKDEVLAELDYSNLTIQAKQAEASLQSANANLAKLINGATSQDVAISQSSANQAETAYNNAKINLENTQKTTSELINQATANLNNLTSGVGSDITAQQQAITTAKTNLENTRNTYQQTVNNRQNLLLTSVSNNFSITKTALDSINRILTDQDAKDTLSIQDQSQLANANLNYPIALAAVNQTQVSLANAQASLTQADIIQAATDCSDLLAKVMTTLNFTFGALEKSVATTKFTQAELDGFKSSISAQLSQVNGSITALQSAQQALSDAVLALDTNVASANNNLNQAQTTYNNTITAAKNSQANAKLSADQQVAAAKAQADANYNAWQLAKAQLDKVTAKPRSEDIKLAQAQVMQAQAALDSINNQISNSIIKSPINGQVTKVNYEIGEQPNLTLPVISVLTQDNYEIDVDISESDITKVRLGNPVSLTFDAFGEDAKFSGEVIFIEPAQTVIQDVVYYKTTIGNIQATASSSELTLELTDSRVISSSTAADLSTGQQTLGSTTASSSLPITNLIKPGMTANAIITTDTENNALIVPDRAIIINSDNSKVIRILDNNVEVDKPVIIGLKGDEGLTQVISGINAGDLVITSLKNATP